ncbi:MAG: helix-turn-helix transcriptional regulator, partial [Atopobiaceae bacterium]|nr:helix-turn-helix transcriptional regulator [Atopobiaceae bacterium]
GPDAHPEIGGSAIELVLDVNEDASIDTLLMNEKRLSKQETGRLRWEAELLCRYQWETGLPFPAVFRTLSPERLHALHADHAELSPEELMQKISVSAMQEESATNLARMRRARGLSQTGLAQKSGVSLRSIQQYEQRKKDISHAQARSVLSLAKALGCTMEELLEAEEA